MVYAKNMKDLKIILKPNNNEVLIKNAIDNYFKTPNEKTLITLICQSISYELALNGLNEIEFNVKKITPNASYVNNVINLNKKTLKNAKKVDFLPTYLKWIFHEISHLKAEKNNELILKSKTNATRYINNIMNNDFYDIVLTVTKDIELAGMGAMWFYQKNKGEQYARENGYKMCVNFLNKFAPNLAINLQTPNEEQKTLLKNIYSAYPDLRYNEDIVENFVVKFQEDCLQKGLNNLSEKELYLLDVSLKEKLTTSINDTLITQLISCNALQIVEKFLANPKIKITKKQLSSISNKYGNTVVEKLIFKENIIGNEIEK